MGERVADLCLTGDTLPAMPEASIRELRNHGGEVIDRVTAGERITITRGGKAVAELRPLPRQRATAAALIERFKRLPAVDPARFRADVDAVVDQSL
ncbi:MAG: type II toxin-antitoxin system prevent-host-death family antitoxin [Actinomycetota bacterium]|nr:type II toxin-antitoxin system prevent-host-death family antitoxin [Actinomycetota bacterium]